MGRTAVAEGQSFLVGAVALTTFLVAHTVVSLGRGNRWIAKAVDHRVRVLVDHGELRRGQLRLCGLTENDVLAKLRELGHQELADLRYVLYETKGELTVVRETGTGTDGALIRAGLATASGSAHRRSSPAASRARPPDGRADHPAAARGPAGDVEQMCRPVFRWHVTTP